MSIKDLLRKNKKSVSLLSIAAVLPFVISSFIVSLIIKYEDHILNFQTEHWLLLYFATSICMAFAFTHTTFIAILSGFFLGWNSVLYVVPTYILASVIGFFLAKKLDKGNFMQSLTEMPKAKILAEELKKNEFKIIVLSRLSPILPFAMMNLVLSFLNADFKKYFFGGLAGMLPRTLIFIWAGTQARDLIDAFRNKVQPDFLSLSFILMVILSIIGLFYYILKAIRNTKSSSEVE